MQKKIKELRAEITKENTVAFLVPKGDKHNGENISPSEERLKWLTGFTGSTGTCIVTLKKAIVFLDGRYLLQGKKEIDTKVFEILNSTEISPQKWLKENILKDEKIAFDPWLHNFSEIENLKKEDFFLKPTNNLIDKIWVDKPAVESSVLNTYPTKYAGQTVEKKFEMLQKKLEKENCTMTFISSPESIMWLLNIRGCDIEFTPTASCFAVVTNKNISLIIDPKKVKKSVKALLPSFVGIVEEDLLDSFLARFIKQKILVNPKTLPYVIAFQLSAQNKLVKGKDPCESLKSIKNETEIKGMKAAQERDGVVLARFFHWLEKEIHLRKEFTEIEAVEKLNSLRSDAYNFSSLSFSTIAGAGKNGAIVHYRVTPKTNTKLKNGDLFLCDSGSQYLEGTTDITRTISVGNSPTAKQKKYFTLVLKGHIAVANAVFPDGVTGSQIDSLARQFLWREGADYAHGTGHGVGAYLNVHEGPQGLSQKNNTPLKAGMILSNEPAYYKENDFGIRIENMMLVKEFENKTTESIDRKMLGFETITLVPISISLIDKKMLTKDEKNWINNYHKTVFKTISPILNGEVRKWLKKATAVI